MSDNIVELGASEGHARGLVVEWDYVALDGVSRLFKACAEVLKDSGVELSQPLFASKLLGSRLAAGLASIAGVDDGEPLAEKVQEIYLTGLAEVVDSPRKEILALAKDMAARGLKIGIVTELSADFVKPLVSGLGLAGAVVVSDTASSVCGFGHKTWARIPHELGLAEQAGVALVASGASLKGAMAANLGVIAIPAPETSFQDFGGADLVADAFTPAIAEAILAALRVEA